MTYLFIILAIAMLFEIKRPVAEKSDLDYRYATKDGMTVLEKKIILTDPVTQQSQAKWEYVCDCPLYI